MAKVLVTGGAGFIGSHVVEHFVKESHEVQVVDDLSSGRKENLPQGVVLHPVTIQSKECADVIAEFKPDRIIHAAAQMSVSMSMKDPMFDTEVNVLGLVNILQAVREHQSDKLPHFVFFSTGGAIYGEQDEFPAPETHAIRPTSIYGVAKFVGERYLDLWSREFGLPFTAVRLSNVYGPRQSPHGEAGVVAIFCQKLLGGEVPTINGTGEFTRDYVYVKDVVKAVALASDTGTSGIFNVGTGVETSVNAIFEAVRSGCEVQVEPSFGPQRIGDQERSSISAAKIQNELGWTADYPLDKGMRETVEWFKAHHNEV